jgi:hypothetical protein
MECGFPRFRGRRHRHLGLIHVKLQSWFPFPIQVYVNGHEWLARRLDRHGPKYLKSDNVFLQVSDLVRAQPESARSWRRTSTGTTSALRSWWLMRSISSNT